MRVDLPYLFAPKGRSRRYYYYRRAGQRIPILGPNGNRLSPEDPGFHTAYAAIDAGFETPADEPPRQPKEGTIAALIAAYLASPEFRQLKPASQRTYRLRLDTFRKRAGDRPVANMPRSWVIEYRDSLGDRPASANHTLAVLHKLFAFAVLRDWRLDNPVHGVARLRGVGEHRPWEEFEIEAFQKRWKPETVERVVFELYLNTGQRGSDIVAMDRRRYRNGEISVEQRKTGVRLWIPASAQLRAVLDPWLEKHGHLMMVTTPGGRMFGKEYLRQIMRAAMTAAGLPAGCTLHGLRYTAATRIREVGLGWEEVADILGHQTAAMARKYMRQRRRAGLTVKRLDEAMKER